MHPLSALQSQRFPAADRALTSFKAGSVTQSPHDNAVDRKGFGRQAYQLTDTFQNENKAWSTPFDPEVLAELFPFGNLLVIVKP